MDQRNAIRIGVLVALVALFTGCTGQVTKYRARSSGLYCYGNMDSSGGVVCVPADQVWSCDNLPNGQVKCLHTPDGQPGWSCAGEGPQITCSTSNPDTGGGPGWECFSGDLSTTCTSVGTTNISPPGATGGTSVGGESGVEWTGSVGDLGEGPGGEGPGGEGPWVSVVDNPEGERPEGEIKDVPRPGDFRTQTPGGWGTVASGNNPGAYRDAHFDEAFPNGLTIGCASGHQAVFTSSRAIQDFLPAGSTPGVLGQSYVNPTTTSAGVLAGQVVAMTLSVGFDAADPNFGASDLAIVHLEAREGPCAGMTAGQILAMANAVLGGCSTAKSPSEINSCVDAINKNFVDGQRSNGFLLTP